jgi:hypothetical protein
MARTDRIAQIQKVEAHRGSRLICCLTSDRQNAGGIIAKDFIPALSLAAMFLSFYSAGAHSRSDGSNLCFP